MGLAKAARTQTGTRISVYIQLAMQSTCNNEHYVSLHVTYWYMFPCTEHFTAMRVLSNQPHVKRLWIVSSLAVKGPVSISNSERSENSSS